MARSLFALFFVFTLPVVACGGSTDSDPGSGGQTSTGGKGGGSGSGSGGATTCDKICNGACVSADDPDTGCGTTSCEPCNTPHASSACSSDGQCVIASCHAGYADCDISSLIHDATGCETHVAFDPLHCGGCDVACTSPGGSVACIDSTCQPNNCPLGMADCTGEGVCSTSLATIENCGSCGNTCTVPNASVGCAPTPGGTGVCTYACLAGFADCDGLKENGCDTNLANDIGNCGACGTPCPSGPHSTAVCQNGACALICDPGFVHCDGSATNGCEKQGASC